MGNSSGSLADYWKVIKEKHGLQGGFIWDWMDQGLLQTDKDGKIWHAYGGDFGERPHDANFNINGMIGPDRIPHPAMIEFKKLAQPVDFEMEGHNVSFQEPPSIRIFNRRYFSTLNDLDGSWQLKINGFLVEEQKLSIPKDLPPQSSIVLAIPSLTKAYARHNMAKLCMQADTAIHLDFCVISKDGKSEVAAEQIQLCTCKHNHCDNLLPWASKILECQATNEPKTEEEELFFKISANGFHAKFPKDSACIDYVNDSSFKWLVSSLGPNLFRAGTDNDGVKQNGEQFSDKSKPLGRWLSLGLDCITLENVKRELTSKVLGIDVSPGASSKREYPAVLTEATVIGWPGKKEYAGIAQAQELKSQQGHPTQIHLGTWRQVVAMDLDGALHVENQITIDDSYVKDLPRWGVEFGINGTMSKSTICARGPHENYVDRQHSAHIGVYEEIVTDCPSTYVVPQEQGNRMQTNWAFFSEPSGNIVPNTTKSSSKKNIHEVLDGQHGLLMIPTSQAPELSASRCTDSQLFAAMHVNELEPSNDTIFVRVIDTQRGIGTGSCGPQTLPKYQFDNTRDGTCKVSFWFKPVGF